ncbi:MAG: protein TonB [Flavobacteriales bacterium]|jgi:protein TonB
MKKIILFTLTMSLISYSIFKKNESSNSVTIYNEEDVFTVVENPPTFPGGQSALDIFIQENLIISRKYKKGNVYTSFIIEKNGSITDVKILRGLTPAQAKEAVRLVLSMQNWNPGKQREEAVRVRNVLPVS